MLLSISLRAEILHKLFRITFTFFYFVFLYIAHNLSPQTVLLLIFKMLMLAWSFSIMAALMSLLDYFSVRVTFCSLWFCSGAGISWFLGH